MGRFARPSAAMILEACSPYLDGDTEIVAFVIGRTSTLRLLYVATERAVIVIRLGNALGAGLVGRLDPREQLSRDGRGQVEAEAGILSLRIGPYRARVTLSDRAAAAEVVRCAAEPAG